MYNGIPDSIMEVIGDKREEQFSYVMGTEARLCCVHKEEVSK